VGIPLGYGQRMLYDAQQRFVRSGLTAYLRVRNWVEDDPDVDETFLEVGVPITPSGAPGQEVGWIDIKIDPPANVQEMGLRNIGLSAGRFDFGATIFYISHTFVLAQLQALPDVTDSYEVWRDRDGHKVIGIFYNGRLYSIEDITHREIGGETISWKLSCNEAEVLTEGQ
jgi:hypothetical protein